MEKLFYTRKEVCASLGISRTTLWRLEREEGFPKGVLIGVRRIGWSLASVKAWAESRSN